MTTTVETAKIHSTASSVAYSRGYYKIFRCLAHSFHSLARSVTLNVCVLPYVMRCTNTVVRIFGYQIVSLLRPVATTKYVLVVQTAAAHSIRNVYIAILNVYITIQYCWFYVVISNSTFQLRRIYTINGYNKKHTHTVIHIQVFI